jgi:hypothetical protein
VPAHTTVAFVPGPFSTVATVQIRRVRWEDNQWLSVILEPAE